MEIEKHLEGNKAGSKNNNDFVTSYFAWVELDEQKKIVERLENTTKKENKK